MRTIISAALAATAFLSGAHAQSFDGDDIEGFIAVMEGAEALSSDFEDMPDSEAAELRAKIEPSLTDFGSLLGEDGDFRIFRLQAEAMDQAGDLAPVRAYRQLVTDSGFGGLPEFGEKADAIMMAWMSEWPQ